MGPPVQKNITLTVLRECISSDFELAKLFCSGGWVEEGRHNVQKCVEHLRTGMIMEKRRSFSYLLTEYSREVHPRNFPHQYGSFEVTYVGGPNSNICATCEVVFSSPLIWNKLFNTLSLTTYVGMNYQGHASLSLKFPSSFSIYKSQCLFFCAVSAHLSYIVKPPFRKK